jgi:hypothetical protein
MFNTHFHLVFPLVGLVLTSNTMTYRERGGEVLKGSDKLLDLDISSEN